MIRDLLIVPLLLQLVSSLETSSEIHFPLKSSEHIDEWAHNKTEAASLSLLNGIASSFSMILTSELLDKTFFIAVVMAMRHSRLTVYLGALTALCLMTVLSTTVGVLTSFIPRWITFYASAVLMFGFAMKMFYDAYRMGAQKGQQELAKIQKIVINKSEDEEECGRLLKEDNEEELSEETFLAVFTETFVLTFLAEWGDRSQVATVLLAATDNIVGVLLGGAAAHVLSTGLAVGGGRVVAECITVRTVTIIGGVVFLLFAVLAIVFNEM